MPLSIIMKIAALSFVRSASMKAKEKMEVKLYVGNLSYDTTSEQLKAMFSEAGQVVLVELIKDRDTGSSKGFGFITMGSQADATKAITMFDGKEMGGRPLKVNTAKEREDRPAMGFNNNFGGNRRR